MLKRCNGHQGCDCDSDVTAADSAVDGVLLSKREI